MYELNKDEINDLEQIKNTYYMKPIINKFTELIDNKKCDWINSLNKIYEILINSENDVRQLIEDRKRKGVVSDISQALKSIAGNAFSNCMVYLFLMNKREENIKSNIFITSKKSRVKDFEKIATIKIGEETQKPDVDLIVYTKKEDGSLDKCIILSLKTS